MSFLRGKNKSKKVVKLLRPLDYRGENYPVETETDQAVHTTKINGVKKLFFKWGPAWKFPEETVFLGVEGTLLTAHPTLEDVKIPVNEFLREVWEPGTYDKLPDKLRLPLETDYGIICGIKATMPDEEMDFSKINISTMMRESHAEQLKDFGKSVPKKNFIQQNLTTWIIAVLSFFVGVMANMKGWI